MRALLIGFFGRWNSGDEVMLRQHLAALRLAGFDQVDLWTEWTDDCDRKGLPAPLRFRCEDRYDLVVIGGGALPVGFGAFPALQCARRGGTPVIASSITLELREAPAWLWYCDRVLCRNADVAQQMMYSLDGPPEFLPDIATTAIPPPPAKRSGELAIVVRDSTPIREWHSRLQLDWPADILVLSQADGLASRRLADRSATVYECWDRPETHPELVSRYRRVLVLGRFHAALYAALGGCELAYFPDAKSPARLPAGPLTWDLLRQAAEETPQGTKVGLPSNSLHEYPRATLAQYTAAFRAAVTG